MMNENITVKQKGFTLLEMAIAMVIIGLLVSFATIAFSGLLKRGYEKNTFSDMEIIADAISIYAQKHMRVPCPADPIGATGATTGGEPVGTERGSTAAGNIFGACNTVATAEGIIPFVTLGLPRKMAQDRFGNFITYRVSITSAQRPGNVRTVPLPVNNWCMTRPYWHADTDNNGATDAYVNLAKAAFCCGTWIPSAAPFTAAEAETEGDIEIQGSFGTSLPNLSRIDGMGGDSDEYRLWNVGNPPTYAELIDPGITGFGAGDSTVPPNFPAYILISHGQNGLGAFQNQIGTRNSLAGMTVPEAENADNDVEFFTSDRTAPLAPGGSNQALFTRDIDDIVFWETPSQVLGRIGGMSCTGP